MFLTRRNFTASALAFTATAGGAQTGFDSWRAEFLRKAARAGLSSATLKAARPALTFAPEVLPQDARQAEVAKPLQTYLAAAAGSARLRAGRQALKHQRKTLRIIERRFGVQKEVLTAIWGLESAYGQLRGNRPVLSTLATLAYEGRRRALFEAELIAALEILEAKQARLAQMRGSGAGAMGHTQFLPSTYQRYGTDFDGNGRADIWGDDPADALASTARLLRAEGWVKGQPSALEVVLPAGFDLALSGRIFPRSPGAWAALGVSRAGGGPLPAGQSGALILPVGPKGPVWMIYQNFHVLKTYNYADSYALAIGHLADRLAGGGPLHAGFPSQPWDMSDTARKRLQQRLTAKGFDAGPADGVIGEKGRAAIRAYERASGARVTGVPSAALLVQLTER